MGENSGDERHQPGSGERDTVEQHAAEDVAPEAIPEEQGGEVGEAIRRAAEEGDEPARRDADEGGEVGDAIRRGAEEP